MNDKSSMPDPMSCDTMALAELASECGKSTKDLWPPALAEMVEVLESYFARSHSENGARFWAESVVAVIAEHFGGRATYLPRGNSLRTALRNLRICQEFDGKNYAVLATRYRMTTIHIRRILKNQPGRKK